jgi:hypothetical protein
VGGICERSWGIPEGGGFAGERTEEVPLRSLGCRLHLQVLKLSVGFMVGICKCRYISFRWQTLEAHLTPAVEEL